MGSTVVVPTRSLRRSTMATMDKEELAQIVEDLETLQAEMELVPIRFSLSVLRASRLGLSLADIGAILQDKKGHPLSRQRVHQIVQQALAIEAEQLSKDDKEGT